MAQENLSANSKVMTLKEGINKYVTDGCSITFGGFSAKDPDAAAHEIIRQGIKHLTVIDDCNTTIMDMLIGVGCIDRYETSWLGISLFDNSYNFRRSIEQGIPNKIEIRDYSNYGMALRFMGGAFNVPFMPTRSMIGTDIAKYNPDIKIIDDPYGTGKIALVPSVQPDVAIIPVQRADELGNCQIFGPTMCEGIKASAAKKTLILCEELIPSEELAKRPNLTVIPHYYVDAVIVCPYACHPWSCYGYYYTDILFYRDYGKAVRTREGFLKWLDTWVLGTRDHKEYCEKLGWKRLRRLTKMEKKITQIPK